MGTSLALNSESESIAGHILVIDDDAELCKLVSRFLGAEGYSVQAVHTGTLGIECALSGNYDLIVLDVMLPDIDGFEVLRRVRAQSNNPILMLTARGDDLDRILGLEMGADEQLRRAIENVVRNAIWYTQPNTNVEVTVHREYAAALSKAVIQVRDHGPGVSSEHLEKIFRPFYRIPASNGEITGSAGLGLAITDRIVSMYGGSASAMNASDGGLIVKLELLLME